MYINKILFAGCILLFLLSCSKNKEVVADKEDTADHISVNLVNVEDRMLNQKILTHGLLTTDEDVKLSFKTPGIIKNMYVKEGDRVKKGQLLAQLDFTEINAQRIQITENYDKAQRDYNRANNLYKDSVITLESLENAKMALNIANQAIDVIDYNIVHSLIKAPSDGVVLQKIANEGEFINPGMSVYEISKEKTGGLIIKVYVSVHDWMNITERDKAYIELDGFPNTKFEGYVKHLSNHTDLSSGLYLIEVQVSKTNEKMVVGMFAKVEIQPSKHTQYKVIPVSCISEGEGDVAYVYVPDGKHVKKIPINIAQIKDGLAYTYSGLQDIDQIINEGAGFLSEKSTISIKL